MPSSILAETAPPTSATPDVHRISRGSATAVAATLGRISRRVFEMPITESASSSSVTLMTPSWAVIADDAHAENVDDESVGAVQAQLLGRQIAQHHADEESDHRGDSEGLRAYVVDARGELAPRPEQGLPRHGHRVDEQLPEELHDLQGVPGRGQRDPPQRNDGRERIEPLRRRCNCGGAFAGAEENLVLAPELQPARPAPAPGAPHQQRAGMVEALDLRQIPARFGQAGRVLQRRLERTHARFERPDIPGPGKMDHACALPGGSDLHIRIADLGSGLLHAHSRQAKSGALPTTAQMVRQASSNAAGTQRHEPAALAYNHPAPRQLSG